MNILRDRIETYFTLLAQAIYQNHTISLVIVLFLTMILLSQMTMLTVNTSNEVFFQEDDSFRVHYGELIIGDINQAIPQTNQQMQTLESELQDNPLYQDYLLSEDGLLTFIDIEPMATIPTQSGNSDWAVAGQKIDSEEYAEMIDTLLPILDQYRSDSLEIHTAGYPVTTDRISLATQQSLAELTSLALIFTLFFLLLLFRRLSGVIYPILVIVLTITSSMGVMAWLSIPFDQVTTLLLTFLSAVAIADSVHLLSGFYQEYDKNGGDKKAAIARSMGRNGLPILMTTLTTLISLACFQLADLASVAHLGLVAAIGTILAFAYTVFLLPVLIAIFPMHKTENDFVITGYVDQILDWIGDTSCAWHKEIITGSIAIMIVGILGVTQLNLSHNALTWLPENEADIAVICIAPMQVETMYDAITSMFKGYGFVLCVITILMIVVTGSLKTGLVSMALNLIPIILAVGLMGLMSIPIDFPNRLIGIIAIGLVVDDSIHFLHNLRHHFDHSGNITIAISDTLHTTGRAIFITSMVLISGIAVSMTADLNSTANSGLISATVIALALLADFFLLPALMFVIYKRKENYNRLSAGKP